MKKGTITILFVSIFFLLFITSVGLAQLPIKPVEPSPKPLEPRPLPPIKTKPELYIPGDRCWGDIEVVLPVVIRYPGRYREETITLNPYQRTIIGVPETFLDSRGRVPIKVIFKLKNKTNKWFRPFPVFITYDVRQGGGQTVSFSPLEEKNIELNIWVNSTSGQYRSFVIGAPRDECGQDDANTVFFNAQLGVYIITL